MASPVAQAALLPLLLTALPVFGASLIVLALARVGIGVCYVQAAAIALAPVLAASVAAFSTERRSVGITLGCLALVALPLVTTGPGPQRWLHLGALSIYVAPIAIPVALVAAAAALREGRGPQPLALAVLAWLLALQPDFAQVLALTAAAAFVLFGRERRLVDVVALLPFAFAGWWAASRPDPLLPVEHVELVFALAFARAPWAGLCVSLAALATVTLLAVRLARIDRALLAVPAYYAVLFVVSLSGITPAPLIGFGAGPWLGFGCMLGMVARPGRRA
ncbi:MAG: hypothetical protein MUC36_22160 [Planctomycetes bacterium]|jgi:cell division protein FtsW (lipid II flippase)|nr:hypothetical protein [Planctomycetota bacterium]